MKTAAVALVDALAFGLDLIDEGETPTESAARVLGETWTALSEEDQLSLAVAGLARRLEDELAARRARPPAGDPEYYKTHDGYKEHIDHSHHLVCFKKRKHLTFEEKAACTERGLREREERRSRKQEEDETRRDLEARAEIMQLEIKAFETIAAAIDAAATQKLREILLQGADGQMRALFDFRLEDARHCANRAQAQKGAWAERVEFFEAAAAVLQATGAATIGEAPEAERQALGAQAIKVWVRGSREEVPA